MLQYEPLDVRIEYSLWYDNVNGDSGVVEFNDLEHIEQFKQSNHINKVERFIGNLE